MLEDDNRIYRAIKLTNSMSAGSNGSRNVITPYSTTFSHGFEFYETIADVQTGLAEKLAGLDETADRETVKQMENEAEARIEQLKSFRDSSSGNYRSAASMVHPYALIKLAGSVEGNKTYLIDSSTQRKWYEIEGSSDDTSYAKNPTTKTLIVWGQEDSLGRFPYSFQDFVFCKYWNKIQNNRMITLRRYAAPVTDNVIPANYDSEGKLLDKPFSPLATAVTYFGEETGNKLSDILSFTVGYKWDEAKGDLWNMSSTQNEAGGNVFGSNVSWLNTGLGAISKMLGIFGDLAGTSQIDSTAAMGLPPDPYASGGAYENRIIGPVNVIDTVKKRARGLEFSNDGLKLTFEYVARPIAGVNNKAIMLDLLSNILVMTSASGMWFGGVQRYRNTSPAIYPWRGKDSLNKLYSGQLLGKDGAFMGMINEALNGSSNMYSSFLQDFMDSAAKTAKSLVNTIKNFVKGGSGDQESAGQLRDNAKDTLNEANVVKDKAKDTLNRVVTAKVMKGATVPWLESMHALLTGAPVGDWHLTIGNPLNPIAVIGNLIVKNCTVTFSDELGPDDFPISFKAVITLDHGMGRDRDAVESMFNRGNGRIYLLSDAMKSSADGETTVDKYTGENNPDGKTNVSMQGRSGWMVTEGSDFVYGQSIGELSISGNNSNLIRNKIDMNMDNINNLLESSLSTNGAYVTYPIAPWTTRYTL